MRLLARHGSRQYHTESIEVPLRIAAPFEGETFACLLWNHSPTRDIERASALVDSLIEGGCRYFVCGGPDCEWWHHLTDELFVSRNLDATDEERKRNHVMTTWHAEESADDVAFFFVFNTSFDDVAFDRFLVLHLGDGPNLEAVNRAVQASLEPSPADGHTAYPPPIRVV